MKDDLAEAARAYPPLAASGEQNGSGQVLDNQTKAISTTTSLYSKLGQFDTRLLGQTMEFKGGSESKPARGKWVLPVVGTITALAVIVGGGALAIIVTGNRGAYRDKDRSFDARCHTDGCIIYPNNRITEYKARRQYSCYRSRQVCWAFI